MATEQQFIKEFYEFKPLEDLTAQDIASIFKAMKLTLHSDIWPSVPEETRKHFIVKNRDGSSYRYGNKRERKPLNQRPTE